MKTTQTAWRSRKASCGPRRWRTLVGGTPRFEELDKLLARAVFVPFAVALDDFGQMVDRLLALAVGVERDGKIEPRLVVERIGRDLLLKLADRADRARLLGDIERSLGGGVSGVVALRLRHLGEHLLRLLDFFQGDVAARQTGKRRDVVFVLGERSTSE